MREVREETGLACVPGAPVGRVRIPGDGVVYDVVDFACTLDPPGPDAGRRGRRRRTCVFADAAALDRAAVHAAAGRDAPRRGASCPADPSRSPGPAGQRGVGSGRPGCSPPRASP